jgi:hypothetical protein
MKLESSCFDTVGARSSGAHVQYIAFGYPVHPCGPHKVCVCVCVEVSGLVLVSCNSGIWGPI